MWKESIYDMVEVVTVFDQGSGSTIRKEIEQSTKLSA